MKIVIAGAGSVGTYLVERLHSEDHDILIIDSSDAVLQKLSSNFDIQTVCGSASSLETLKESGVESADIFIAATPSDETNLISCLLADHANIGLRKIARVRELVTDSSGLSPRISAVFDQFINPDLETANLFLRLFEVSGASDFMEFGEGRVSVVGVIPEQDAPIIGAALKDLPKLHDDARVLVVALMRKEGLIIPKGDDVVELGDEVFIALEPKNFSTFCSILGKCENKIKSAIIYGGSSIGRYVAKGLARKDVKVKLIEPNAELCEQIAEELSNVLVLNGEGTDQELLGEENVAEVDVFFGAAEDEEKNILAAILAKKMGASQNAVVVANRSYLDFVSELGIDLAINPQIAAASQILKFIRKGSVSSIFSTRDDIAEVLEIIAIEGSKIVGVEIQDLKLPEGVIVAAVFNDDFVTIPQGDTIIKAGEKVIFFAARDSLDKLQQLIDSKSSLF